MDLDNLSLYHQIDKSDMLAEIQGLTEQLAFAWKTANDLRLQEFKNIKSIILSGMGGSAIGADLLMSYISSICPIPISVIRDYHLPGWAKDEDTLVVASSHSGNTEETVSILNEATHNHCATFVITTGGELAKIADERNIPIWLFTHGGQPRAAVGYSFGYLLALFVRLGVIPAQDKNMDDTINAMSLLRKKIDVDVPVKDNTAKRLAGQLMNRWISVFASDYLAPVARRWKTQINELAKAWAQFEFLPEADHNTLAGIEKTEDVLSKTVALFISSSSDNPRNQLRAKLTQKEFLAAGISTELINFEELNPLGEMWTSLLFGDYLAYYLAIAYQIDPTPVEMLENLKKSLKQ